MARLFRKRIENKGMPPGALVFIGTRKVDAPQFEYYHYNSDFIDKGSSLELKQVPEFPENANEWINLEGVHDADIIHELGEQFQIHPLVLEDLMNTGQRSGMSLFDDSLFVTIRMLFAEGKEHHVQSEQLSFILFDQRLISVQESNGDTFNAVRHRLENAMGKVRKMKTDYLLYILLDSVIDNYIYLIEEIGSRIDDLELELLDSLDKGVLKQIDNYKRELHFMAKVVKPAVLMLRELSHSDTHLLSKSSRPYYRDLYGLSLHAMESIDSYRIVLNDYLNAYHLSMSTRLNDIMRVLTVFSAIFIPLTFFAGIYGMNFEYIPELSLKWAYPAFWVFILIVTIFMLFFFRRKNWL
jgi:magnesium transporter